MDDLEHRETVERGHDYVAELEAEVRELRQMVDRYQEDLYPALKARCKRMKPVVEAARKANTALDDLIAESEGVAGLHLNGDVAPWESLCFGGAYEQWLQPFDTLSKTLTALDAEGDKG